MQPAEQRVVVGQPGQQALRESVSTTRAAAPATAARPALATSASTRITSATPPSAKPKSRCGANALSAPTASVRKAPSPARKICTARSSRKAASAQWKTSIAGRRPVPLASPVPDCPAGVPVPAATAWFSLIVSLAPLSQARLSKRLVPLGGTLGRQIPPAHGAGRRAVVRLAATRSAAALLPLTLPSAAH